MIYSIIIYFVILALVGFIYQKHSSSDDFLIANRENAWFAIAASIFTLIGGGELATLSSLSFSFGFSGIYLFVGYCIGFILLIFLTKKIRHNSEVSLLHSLPDYFYEKYGKYSGAITTILSFLAFFSLLIIQFSAGGQIVSALIGWDYTTSVIVTGIIVSIYLFLGGFKGVLATDVIQGIAMIILLPIVIWFITKNESVSLSSLNFESLGTFPIFSIVLTGIFTAMASADVWQRIYSAKNDKSAKTGLLVGSSIFILFGLGLVLFGMIIKYQLPDIDPNNAFVSGVADLLPTGLASIVFVLVLSAILSTADTEVFLLSSISSREISRWKGGYKNNEQTSKMTSTGMVRTSIVVITVLSLIASLYFDNLVTTYIFLLGVVLLIAPPLLLSFFINLNDRIISISILISSIVFVFLISTQNLNVDNLVLIVIPSTIITLLLSFIPTLKNKNIS